MLKRLRESLALLLALQYAAIFAISSGILFGLLYLLLAYSFDKRELARLEQQRDSIVAAFDRASPAEVVARIKNDVSPEMSAAFVRLTAPDGTPAFEKVPNDWIETEVRKLPLGPFTIDESVQVVRVPQNAERDYTLASHQWANGWKLHVGRILESRSVLLAPLRRAFTFAGAGALVLSFGCGIFVAWRATRPLRLVSDTARRILETGDLTARVPSENVRGELATLIAQLNTLLDKNTTHVRVLRETLDNLAHDLRTPLTRLRGTAELALGEGGNPADAREALADCVDESDRVLHLLESLLDISAAEAGALKLNRDLIDVRSLTERAVDLYQEVAQEKKISLVLDQPKPVEVAADAVRLGQAITNLVDNALKYTPAGGTVTVSARHEPGAAFVTVSDNGPGVPLGEREAIFRRLYRGDSSRSQRGLGLGLSMVKAIVESHGGTVTVGDAPGGGASFTVRIPR